jgi:hypothetical protein
MLRLGPSGTRPTLLSAHHHTAESAHGGGVAARAQRRTSAPARRAPQTRARTVQLRISSVKRILSNFLLIATWKADKPFKVQLGVRVDGWRRIECRPGSAEPVRLG